MKKIIYIFIFSFVFSFAYDFKTIKTPLLKVDDIYGYIKDNDDIKINSSGVVVSKFDDTKSIIARASVIEKKDGMAKLEFRVFDMLEQPALPLPNILPQVGDEVVLNYLYNRAFILAPNEKTYNYIENKLSNMQFTHIDVFGAQLIQDSVISPARSDFRKFCSNNAIGLAIFALKDKAYVVDCQDFKTLYNIDIPNYNEVQIPFYSRVGGYTKKFFDFDSQEIGNYYKYYDFLINY